MGATEAETRANGLDIKEVAGGCICCSAGFMFEVSLMLLLQRRPDRLIIEPTGLAAMSGILDTLDRDGIREAVDVRSVICLLDPTRFQADLDREAVADQVEAADILVANRMDMATTESIDAFSAWAAQLFPKKNAVIRVAHGQLSASTLDAVSNRAGLVQRAGHQHEGHRHSHEHDHDHDHRPRPRPRPRPQSQTTVTTTTTTTSKNIIMVTHVE